MSRSTKMYGNSPRIERKDDGKLAITRPEKKTQEPAAATALPEDVAKKQELERSELLQRHQKDYIEMMAKHMAEGNPASGVAEEKTQETKGE